MPKLITDAAVRAAVRAVERGDPSVVTLSDPAPRGAGRLVLRVRRSGAEWFSQRFVDGERRLQKLGAYPGMTIADARARFGGRAPETASGRATVEELFAGYVASLEAAGKPAAPQVAGLLAHSGSVIGRSRLARDVTPADIVRVIRPVFERGARVQADKYRMYMSAAFRWAMRSAHDYRVEGARSWGVASNPCDAVPRDTEAEGVGNRYLSAAEFRAVLAWALAGRRPVHAAVAVLLLTGQRVREVAWLRAAQWDSEARLLRWETTKNGLPHVLPVCTSAAAVLDARRPSPAGYLFAMRGEDRPIADGIVLVALRRFAARNGMESFTGRDLRRTWKTLAGAAGLSKQERDWLQNHMQGQDVSSRHYDRHDNLAEKRAAVLRWQAWLDAMA